MTKKLLLDGVFFADWAGTLEEAAELAGVPVERFSFDPEQGAEAIREQRREAYRLEADPLKFEAEYDAMILDSPPDYAAWRAKVQEIKDRYPLPTEPDE
ncbi:hypothetical protein KPP23_038 [Pseudomonas phage KPP23]|nr:hypothetical protein KPP23_038 [Pseudomonas phage KPP23]